MDTVRVCAVGFLIGCAATLWGGCAPAQGPGSKGADASRGRAVDAVLPTGRGLFLFDFAAQRYQKWPVLIDSDSAAARAISDSLGPDRRASERWLALQSPGMPFSPMQAIWGPGGTFLLLDRAGRRLSLYDTNAQYVSSLPLPQEISERTLERMQVFQSREGVFSFLDLGEGKAWQYSENRVSGNRSDWRLRGRMNLPLGMTGCLWEPFSRDLCCVGKGGDGVPVTRCLDAYLNPVSSPATRHGDSTLARGSMDRDHGRPPPITGFMAVADSARSAWILRLASPKPVCYLPSEGAFVPCPQ